MTHYCLFIDHDGFIALYEAGAVEPSLVANSDALDWRLTSLGRLKIKELGW